MRFTRFCHSYIARSMNRRNIVDIWAGPSWCVESGWIRGSRRGNRFQNKCLTDQPSLFLDTVMSRRHKPGAIQIYLSVIFSIMVRHTCGLRCVRSLHCKTFIFGGYLIKAILVVKAKNANICVRQKLIFDTLIYAWFYWGSCKKKRMSIQDIFCTVSWTYIVWHPIRIASMGRSNRWHNVYFNWKFEKSSIYIKCYFQEPLYKIKWANVSFFLNLENLKPQIWVRLAVSIEHWPIHGGKPRNYHGIVFT